MRRLFFVTLFAVGLTTILLFSRSTPTTAQLIAQQPSSVLSVDIAVKPGSDRSPVNIESKGKVPVAVLSTDIFDATTIITDSVSFGITGTEGAATHASIADVNGDKFMDMMFHFNTQNVGAQCGAIQVSLTGETTNGEQIQGFDSIETVGCKE